MIHRHPSWGPCPCGVDHDAESAAAATELAVPERAPLPVRLRVWLLVVLGCLAVWALVVAMVVRLLALVP